MAVESASEYGSYQSNRYDSPVRHVPVKEVLQLQADLMQTHLTEARTQVRAKRPPKMTGFAALYQGDPVSEADIRVHLRDQEDIHERLTNGSLDVYLGVVARRLAHRDWRLTVSFLFNRMNEELHRLSLREIHQFEWHRGDEHAQQSMRYVLAGHRMDNEVAYRVSGTGTTNLMHDMHSERAVLKADEPLSIDEIRERVGMCVETDLSFANDLV